MLSATGLNPPSKRPACCFLRRLDEAKGQCSALIVVYHRNMWAENPMHVANMVLARKHGTIATSNIDVSRPPACVV